MTRGDASETQEGDGVATDDSTSALRQLQLLEGIRDARVQRPRLVQHPHKKVNYPKGVQVLSHTRSAHRRVSNVGPSPHCVSRQTIAA